MLKNNEEKILNIYLVINEGIIEEFRAKEYIRTGSDEEKIDFLISKSSEDFESARVFDSPENDKGNKITYRVFEKFEMQGIHFNLFENIFKYYRMGDSPLVCITPVNNGVLKINK